MNLTRGTYNVVRSVVVTVLVAIVALVALAYLLLLSPPVQQRLCREGEKALGEFLRPEFINRVDEVVCFNKLTEANLRDIAILYRAHYLSRSLEEAFIKNDIPYRILAGTDSNKDQSYFLCQLSKDQIKGL